MAITRRSFLKGVATTSAASVIGPSLLASASANAVETTGTWKVTGSHWGAFRAHIYAGKVQEIEPLELDKKPNRNVERHQGYYLQPFTCALPNGSSRLVEETQIQRGYSW